MVAGKFFAAAVLIAALPQIAAAQETAAPAAGTVPMQEMGGDSVTAGVGIGYMPDYEGSDDYRFVPAPAAIGTIGGISFTVLGNRASADLIPDRPGPGWDFQAGPSGVINFMRNSRQNIGDPRVRRLGRRGTAVELGGYVGIGRTGIITSPYDKLSLSVSYRHDVTGTHKSGVWQPTITYFTPLSTKSAVGLFASAEHVERDYVATYYDVGPAASVHSGLPEFNGRGGWKNWTVGAMGAVSLTGDLLKGFKVVGGGSYRRLINDSGRSPLVSIAGSRNQWLGALGLAYTF